MIRKTIFWIHLSAGAIAGVFIFFMAATGAMLSFERQSVNFIDRDLRSVSVPNDAQARPMNDLLETVRRTGLGEPTAITVRNEPQATTQFSLGRNKVLYVDPYCGAVLGASSIRAHEFFQRVEQLHRSLGAPLGSKTVGHWVAAISNLLFGVLILLGLVLWVPRNWSWKAIRASMLLRAGLRGRPRDWNWHNVLGIWCAVPLLVIALTGVVMSFDWANALLFRLSGSSTAVHARNDSNRPSNSGRSEPSHDPNYEHLFTVAKRLDPDWHTITLNVAASPAAPISVVVDTGTGGQPQTRTQYLLNRDTGALLKVNRFADGSLGQRMRAFVRFGHTGEYGGVWGQVVAALAFPWRVRSRLQRTCISHKKIRRPIESE